MKILLVGEYSRLHNSLKEGLLELGHEVVILGFGDGFKDFPADFKLTRKWDSGILRKIRVAIYKTCGFDIGSYLTYRQFIKNKDRFRDFDVVQLINENSFYCTPDYEIKILKNLFANNKKSFLLTCGPDFLVTKYEFENIGKKSILMPYTAGKVSDKAFINVLKFRTKSFKKLHDYVYENISGIIASDIDYHIPLSENPKYLGMIPNPINTQKLKFSQKRTEKIKIFHGINNETYYLKGSDYFEKALDIIRQRYPDKVSVKVTRSIPYTQYIKTYDDCHILLDQAYAFDQGYNALEAMAKGKVVFTGAETEFIEFYDLDRRVAVNAVPDVDAIVSELSFLIENPDEIDKIGKAARAFIEREHDHRKVAAKYLEMWNQ